MAIKETPVTVNGGTMTISDDAVLPLGGTIDNAGTIALNSTGDHTEVQIIGDGVTLDGGGQVTLSADSGTIDIGTVVTPATTLYITGGANDVTVGAITDAALTAINAENSSAPDVYLGTSTAPLTQASLHIYGQESGSGDLVVYASGNNDVFEENAGTGTSLFGEADGNGDKFYVKLYGDFTANGTSDIIQVFGASGANLTANGGGDKITVDYAADMTANGTGDTINVASDGGGNSDITANGNGDTITVGDGGELQADGNGTTANPETITFTGNAEIGAPGNDVTINLYDGNDHLASTEVPSIFDAIGSLGSGDTINVYDASARAWIGNSTTINLYDGAYADLNLEGDFTGGNSSYTLSNNTFTTITGVGVDGDTLRLHFNDNSTEVWAGGSSENSQVNVATATSLASALDLAASQAAVMNFQFDGHADAAVVGTSAGIDGYTGLIVWFQYQGNTYIVEANNFGSTAAAHSALGANDVVVELTGLVDVNHISVATH